MPPCLRSPDRDRNRQPHWSNSPPQHHGRRPRSASLPVATLPLRGCCKACIPAVDAYLASPTDPEHMTSGAKRLLRSTSQHQKSPSGSKVIVDEVDMIRNDIRRISINEEASTEQGKDLATKNGSSRPKLSLGVCFFDDAEECELFPLPSPSPRNSPRQSPSPSPSASQTNLSAPTSKSTPSPVLRGNSPLSLCCSNQTEEPVQSTKEYLREEVQQIVRAGSQSPVKAESPPSAFPKTRRPSLSGFSNSFSKGGFAIVKGFSGLGGNHAI